MPGRFSIERDRTRQRRQGSFGFAKLRFAQRGAVAQLGRVNPTDAGPIFNRERQNSPTPARFFRLRETSFRSARSGGPARRSQSDRCRADFQSRETELAYAGKVLSASRNFVSLSEERWPSS